MLSIPKHTFFFFCLAVSLALFGCAPTQKPTVWKKQNASFAGYRVIEVQPVSNAAGVQIDQDILAILVNYLRDQFKEEDLPVMDSAESTVGVLFIQSELVVFAASESNQPYLRSSSSFERSSSWERIIRCTLRTRLVDKATNEVLAEVVVNKVAPTGDYPVSNFGPSIICPDCLAKLLKAVASETAAEVASLVRTKIP